MNAINHGESIQASDANKTGQNEHYAQLPKRALDISAGLTAKQTLIFHSLRPEHNLQQSMIAKLFQISLPPHRAQDIPSRMTVKRALHLLPLCGARTCLQGGLKNNSRAAFPEQSPAPGTSEDASPDACRWEPFGPSSYDALRGLAVFKAMAEN